MNILELSKGKNTNTQIDDFTSKKRKKKLIIILSIVVGVLLLLLIARLVYAYIMYKIYAKPMVSNDKLVYVFDDETGTLYDASIDNVDYKMAASVGNFPYWNGGLVSTQIFDNTIIDQDNKLVNEIELNLTYSVELDGTVTYYVDVSKIKTNIKGNEIEAIPEKSARIYFTSSLKYIEGNGTVGIGNDVRDLTDSEIREFFEENKASIKDYLEKMWDFFGKDNFKKQDKVVKQKDRNRR